MATVNDGIARILKAEGVEWIAAFPQQTLIDSVTLAGIRPIITRTERTGVNMADGFSRVRNREAFGVFTMQQGPGAENAFPGAAQAFADSIPLLLLPGGPPGDRTQVHPSFEAAPGYRRVTKWAANINQPGRVSELMRVAFSQMRHGRPGPVLVEIPADVAGEEAPDLGYEPPRELRSRGRRGRRARSRGRPAARRAPGDPRRPRDPVGPGLGRADRLRRAGGGAGDDDHGRQERLPGGPRAGPRHGRALGRAHGGAVPGEGGLRPRHRLEPDEVDLRLSPAGEGGRSPRSPTIRST